MDGSLHLYFGPPMGFIHETGCGNGSMRLIYWTVAARFVCLKWELPMEWEYFDVGAW